MRLGEGTPNGHGLSEYEMVCETCGRDYTVTSSTVPDGAGWENCLAPDCKSYDITRDPFHMFDPEEATALDLPRSGDVN